MAGDAPRVILMREGANRAIGYALLASIVLHALALATLPSLRELAAPLPPEPEPLIARVERLPPPPAPRPPEPVREARKPPAPRPKPAPRPPPLVAKPALEPAAAPPPAPAPAPPPPPTPQSPVEASPQAAPAPPPPAPAEPGTVAPAPPPGPAPAEVALRRYQRGVTQAAARFKRYPRVAIDNDWQGEVVVRMAIGADGRIASLSVKAGSGFPVLDRQALDMFRNAKPLVPIPPELRGREFELDLRAVYDLREAR